MSTRLHHTKSGGASPPCHAPPQSELEKCYGRKRLFNTDAPKPPPETSLAVRIPQFESVSRGRPWAGGPPPGPPYPPETTLVGCTGFGCLI